MLYGFRKKKFTRNGDSENAISYVKLSSDVHVGTGKIDITIIVVDGFTEMEKNASAINTQATEAR